MINCQYSMATFSTAERKRRPHGDRKSTEMSLHLKQTFEAAVMTQLYPRSQIDIFVKVNSERGGGVIVSPILGTISTVLRILSPDRSCSQTAGTTACA